MNIFLIFEPTHYNWSLNHHEQIIKQEEDNLNEIEMNWNFYSIKWTAISLLKIRWDLVLGSIKVQEVFIDRYRKSHNSQSHLIPWKVFNRKHIPLRIYYSPSYYEATCQLTLYYIKFVNHVCTQMTWELSRVFINNSR